MLGDLVGLKFPDICLTGEEKPQEKFRMGGSPGELSEELVT